MKILLVEDDLTIAEILQRQLCQWGYETHIVKRFDTVLEIFLQFEPHLVILDISLPFFSGYYWCQEIRKQSSVPILFLSSASDEMNQVMALNMGGDDYICKPFHMDVVIAKIQAMLRRAYHWLPEALPLQIRGIQLDTAQACLLLPNGEKTDLTRNEFLILSCLMEQPGKPVSRETLMRKLWQDENYIDDNTLTVNMTRLRKKLEEVGLTDFIHTRKGLGYEVK